MQDPLNIVGASLEVDMLNDQRQAAITTEQQRSGLNGTRLDSEVEVLQGLLRDRVKRDRRDLEKYWISYICRRSKAERWR